MRFVPLTGPSVKRREVAGGGVVESPGPCVVFSHLPPLHGAARRNAAGDSPRSSVLREAGNVVAVVAGHSHSGGSKPLMTVIHHGAGGDADARTAMGSYALRVHHHRGGGSRAVCVLRARARAAARLLCV